MIILTGDIHGNIDIKKLNTKSFPQQKILTKEDYLIILGDFGLLDKTNKMENYYLNWLNNKNFTTLFVDGNHEDYNVLNKYPTIEMFGGKVQQISESIFHLMRGEIYNIDGKTFFVMGGAESHSEKIITMDEYIKNKRKYTIISDDYEVASVIGRDWFPEEMPNAKEYKNGLKNLQNYKNKIDYILTHCAPAYIEKILDKESPRNTNIADIHIVDYFNEIDKTVEFKKWYFGHYHMDFEIDEKHQCLYNSFEILS